MNIGLFDIDNVNPNLALMKISAYHKKLGDKVHLFRGKDTSLRLINLDKQYISCVFEDNKKYAELLKFVYPEAEIGGVGINNNKLSEEIEHIMPDYELYNIDYSMGFTTRGCIRKCEFCKVHTHEGILKPNCDIYEFWDKRHKHIVLLDNNILGNPQHFKKISQQIIDNKLSVDFNQGLDIRLVNEDNIEILKKLNIKPELRFAFDDIKLYDIIEEKLKLLKEKNVKRAMFYVLVGFNSSKEDDLKRLELLRKYNQRAYCMRYKDCRHIKWYDDLAAWVNQPRFFISMDLNTFIEKRKRLKFI